MVKGHVQNGVYTFVRLDRDIPGRFHILPAEVQKIIAVVQNRDGLAVPIGRLQLGQALQDDTDADFPGADNGADLVEVRDAPCGGGGKVIHDEPDRDTQPVPGTVVGILAERMESLRIKQRYQCVHGTVCVTDIQEHSGLSVGEVLEIDLLRVGEQLLRPIEGIRSQLFGNEALNAGIGSGRALDIAEHLILGCRKAVRRKLADLRKQPVKVAGAHFPQEPDHTAEMVFFIRKVLQRVADHRRQRNPCGLFPEGVMLGVDRGQCGSDLKNILLVVAVPLFVTAHIQERVISARGVLAVGKVDLNDLIAVCHECLSCRPAKLSLAAGGNHALVALEYVWKDISPGFA